MDFSFYSLPSTTTLLIISVLLCFMVRSGIVGTRKKLLCFFLGLMIICMGCEALAIAARDQATSLLWDKLMYVTISLFPAVLLSIGFTYTTSHLTLAKLCLIFTPAAAFIGMLPTPYLLSHMTPAYWGWTKVTGPAFIYFRIYFVFYLIWSLIVSKTAYNNSAAAKTKHEIIYYTAATILPIAAGIFILGICPLIGIKAFNIILLSACITVFALVLTYGIAVHRLFDIGVFIPGIGRRKKHFRRQAERFMDRPFYSCENLVCDLGELFECDVALRFHGRGKTVATLDCPSRHIDFSRYEMVARYKQPVLIDDMRLINAPGYTAMQACGIDAILPVESTHSKATITIGRGLCQKIYSKQDYHLMLRLHRFLKTSLAQITYIDELRRPVLIASSGGEIISVMANSDQEVFLMDCDRESIHPIG